MGNKVIFLVCFVLLAVLYTLVGAKLIKTTADCPEQGFDNHGYWTMDIKDNQPRCILKCYDGFEPDGCYVLRENPKGGWNFKEPHCVKESLIPSLKTVGKAAAAVGVGAAAVAAAPVALTAAGFTSAGVAAGSVAAGLQGSATVAGGWFAAAQSAGAAGLAATTKVGLFSAFSGVTGTISSFFGDGCELE